MFFFIVLLISIQNSFLVIAVNVVYKYMYTVLITKKEILINE
jgi:hypothetical protein